MVCSPFYFTSDKQVANKLFPMASISKKIEDFANEKLDSVLVVIPSGDSAATETATSEAHNVCLMLLFLSCIFVLIRLTAFLLICCTCIF